MVPVITVRVAGAAAAAAAGAAEEEEEAGVEADVTLPSARPQVRLQLLYLLWFYCLWPRLLGLHTTMPRLTMPAGTAACGTH